MYERQDGQGLEVGSYAHRADPPRARRDPVDRGGGALADRAAVHAGGLRAAAGAGARARCRRSLGDESRRDQVRDQRAAVADARRAAAARRDARGEGALVGGRRLGQGRARRRQVGRRVDDARRVGDRPAVVRRRALLHVPEDAGRTCRRARRRASTRRTGSSIPAEQWESNRGVRLSPFYERERELGAVFFEAAAWERPHWYESNAKLLDEFGDRIKRREAEWESRWWSPIINAEHLAMRERAAMFDLTAFCDLRRRSARARSTCVQRSRCARWTCRRPGRLHAGADAGRRLPVRPDDHAARRRARSASSRAARTGWPT